MEEFIEAYNVDVDRFQREKGVSLDDFVHYETVKWSESLKKNCSGVATHSI